MGRRLKLSNLHTNRADLPVFLPANLLEGVVSTPYAGPVPSSNTFDHAWKPDGSKVYVASFTAIYEVDGTTFVATLWAGDPTTAGFADGTGTAARFTQITALAMTPDGTALYVADSGKQNIRKIAMSTVAVTTAFGPADGSGTGGLIDANGTAARVQAPAGLAISKDSSTMYGITFSSVRKFNLSTTAVTTLASSGLTTAEMVSLSADDATLYIANKGGNNILSIPTAGGALSVVAGSGTSGYAEGIGAAAQFTSPWAVQVDPTGNYLYVSEYGGNRVRRVNLDGKQTYLVAGSTTGVGGTADGTGAAASFNAPLGLHFRPGTAQPGTDLYVTGYTGKNLRKVN
jgi:DNA-binding beta-propeller fold protein YncE